jgi:hypothetical protein
MEELSGCWQEARRVDMIIVELLSLRTTLAPEFYEQITAAIEATEICSRLLRDIYDLFPIYRSRVPMLIYYLKVFLPSLQKTARDMKIYLDNTGT